MLAAALSVGAAARAQDGGVGSSTPAPREPFLVLPFANTSPVKQLDWMTSALAVTTAEKLEGLGNLRPLYGPRVLELVETEENGKKQPIGGTNGLRNEAVVQRAFDLGNTLVSYDPNVRPVLIADHDAVRTSIERCVAASHIVKTSDEDASYLYPDATPAEVAARWCALGALLVVVTHGADGAVVYVDGVETLRRPGACSSSAAMAFSNICL